LNSTREPAAASSTGGGPYLGLNFATVQPLGGNSRVIFAGQTGTSNYAPNRFEAVFETRIGKNHQLRMAGSVAKAGTFKPAGGSEEKELGQISFQALDQWQVREGFILVYGFDYARFIGGGNNGTISPRLGAQYDVNAKTRLNASYTAGSEDRVLQSAVEMEGEPILFHTAPLAANLVDASGQPVLNKNRRFEIGIERVLLVVFVNACTTCLRFIKLGFSFKARQNTYSN